MCTESPMTKTTRKIAAIVALVGMTQTACYNSYFITTTELEKLESSVEQSETVEVYGDCPSGTVATIDSQTMWAQAETPDAPAEEAPAPTEEGETATDAPAEAPAAEEAPAEAAPAEATGEATATTTNPNGCTKVNVAAGNPLFIIEKNGNRDRVTPFNFIMSGGQLVSPEYDVLMQIDDVKGAEVREFSTWKTVGTIAGVSAVAIGTFIAIAVLAPSGGGFQVE